MATQTQALTNTGLDKNNPEVDWKLSHSQMDFSVLGEGFRVMSKTLITLIRILGSFAQPTLFLEAWY
jgi:hypothetical protein